MPALPSDDGLFTWVDCGDHRIFVVGFTDGGAPFGVVEAADDSWLDDQEVSIPGFR